MTTAEIQNQTFEIALDLYRIHKRLESLADAIVLPVDDVEQSLEFDIQGCLGCSGHEVEATAQHLHESALMNMRKLEFKRKQQKARD